MNMETLGPVFEGMAAGAGMAAFLYLRKWARRREPFDGAKFGSTVVVGALVAASIALSGRTLTEGDILVGLATYGGLIVVVESILRAAIDEYQGVRYEDTEPESGEDAEV